MSEKGGVRGGPAAGALPSLHSGALGVSTDPPDQLCLHSAGAQ